MEREHIARISYGKDSLKMLDVIKTRGLPLDRITTTDVWATETISANLPPVNAFKEFMDQWIWDHYRIEVEHLCARNKDGTKRTYEQMFYHIPARRSQTVKVERERENKTRNYPRIPGPVESVVSNCAQTEYRCTECKGTSPASLQTLDTIGARSSRWNGFPAQISPWCRKLKIDKVKTPFLLSPPQRARTEILWNIWALQQMSRSGLDSSTRKSGRL